jgi:hypothetical protein
VIRLSSHCRSRYGHKPWGIISGRVLLIKTLTLAVQVVVSLRDVPVATALTMFFMQAGSAVFLAVGQAVLLNNLLPQMQAINPALTTTDLIDAGAIGLK